MKNKSHSANKKLIICEIVFCGLATRRVHIVIHLEMPIAENSIRYRGLSIEINVTEEHLRSGTTETNSGQQQQ
jgi:hypothetical protein